jgi:hypothetical protein
MAHTSRRIDCIVLGGWKSGMTQSHDASLAIKFVASTVTILFYDSIARTVGGFAHLWWN